MHLEQERGCRTDGRQIIRGMRAIGCPNLNELRARAGHDVRHAERAADLDQLAARHDGFAAKRQRVQDEKHRGCIVVDDGRVLGSGELAYERPHMIVAFAASARCDVELERHRVAHGSAHRRGSLLCDERAAEIGVQYGSSQVENRAQRWALRLLEADQRLGGEVARLRHFSPGTACRPCFFERVPDGARRGLLPEALDSRSSERRPQNPID